eukprot:8144256-Pyramimonas_sp.AAC.1
MQRAHRGPHFWGAHAVLCHAIAQWRDKPRASTGKRQRAHRGPHLLGAHAVLCHAIEQTPTPPTPEQYEAGV